jgi:post-segregation antitoxin (ccd killing protein)
MGKVELKIEVDSKLVEQARDAGVSINSAAEEGLQRALSAARAEGIEERARQWAAENVDAIRDHEERIAEGGIFGEDFRTW